MQNTKKPAKKPIIVTKPYLTGSPTDGDTLKSSLKFFGSLVIMAFAYLLLGSILLWDSLVLRVLTNGAMMAVVYLLFYNSGAGLGAAAVNTGEIMYQRRETGREVDAGDQAKCYHSAKGFVNALIGTVPLLVCAVLLAVLAQKQETGLSTLPSWLSTYERRGEIGGALAFYHVTTPMSLEDMMRLVVRMTMMPLVSIVGSANKEGLLLLERLSPLVSLLPGVFYGFGYLRGVSIRTRVHSDIAANKRKRARKERKARQARAAHAPEQLN